MRIGKATPKRKSRRTKSRDRRDRGLFIGNAPRRVIGYFGYYGRMTVRRQWSATHDAALEKTDRSFPEGISVTITGNIEYTY